MGDTAPDATDAAAVSGEIRWRGIQSNPEPRYYRGPVATMSNVSVGAIEELVCLPADGKSLEETLAFDRRVMNEYASQQPGYIERFTTVTPEGQVKVFIHWETVADMEASQTKAKETELIGEYSHS